MKNARLLLSIPIAAAALLFYTGSTAIAQQHDHEMKVGKTGEVSIMASAFFEKHMSGGARVHVLTR